MQDLIYQCLKNVFFWPQVKNKKQKPNDIDCVRFPVGFKLSISRCAAVYGDNADVDVHEEQNTECVVVRVMVSSAAFFFPLLPVATLVTTNKPCLPPCPLMSHSGCVHENPNKCGDNSLGFVHDTEGEWKASSNFLKLSLRNEAVLVVIVVFEHRLWERRWHERTLLLWYFVSSNCRSQGGLHLHPPFSAHVCWWCGGQAEGQLLKPSPQTLEA